MIERCMACEAGAPLRGEVWLAAMPGNWVSFYCVEKGGGGHVSPPIFSRAYPKLLPPATDRGTGT